MIYWLRDLVAVLVMTGIPAAWVLVVWRKWINAGMTFQQLRALGMFSYLSMVLATLGLTELIGETAYAWLIHGPFEFYDPLLMQLYLFRLLMSMAGLVLGLIGLARKSIFRFHAPGLNLFLLLIVLSNISSE